MKLQYLLLFSVVLLSACQKNHPAVKEFQKTLSIAGDQEAHRLISHHDGLVLVGTNKSSGEQRLQLIKVDFSGTVLDELNFDSDGDQRGNDIIEHNGSYYICGSSSINGDSDTLLIKRPM